MSELKLSAGDHHYKAYVGPPTQYDFMGASQFRLLCTLGLRGNHKLLDFGCGSLRAGRLFIAYLDEGCYYGVEPNKWLIEEAIKYQIGEDLIRIKKTSFDYNDEFLVHQFETQFDFIVAQSIFSHTGIELVELCLKNFSECLKNDGIIVATFVESNIDFAGKGWVYPESVTFCPNTIKQSAKKAGLVVTRIPWYHPRQTWYIFAKHENRLPNHNMKSYLQGAVLLDPEFKASYKLSAKTRERFLNSSYRMLYRIKKRVKAWLFKERE